MKHHITLYERRRFLSTISSVAFFVFIVALFYQNYMICGESGGRSWVAALDAPVKVK